MPTTTPTGRTAAVIEASNRTPRYLDLPHNSDGTPLKVSDYFGDYSLSLAELKSKLSADERKQLEHMIETDHSLDPKLATRVAQVVRDWAVARGATHFTHWFQPQTEWTAEKHDAFLAFDENRKPIDILSASFLLQSEPDASSFPSGGLRATHEARGYTIWDPTSPVFITENGNTKYLCIPSVFIGYNGEFLDERGPLLKSSQVLSEKATKLLHLLGETAVAKVVTTLGPEQEYFAIDRAFVMQRPDLMMTGRTLVGARPPKGQQLEDHYFGSIPDRIQAFMAEVEFELYRLGVPVKTRHNEVAPAQYETAPVFEESDIATDHNQLTMTVLRRVAKKHDLEVLLHEKPFAGINGSGKHCNWSMAAVGSKNGANLLEPGANPRENIRFLLFLMATLKGVHKHGGLLRAGIASAGNDHRLGANEAPPAIISAFLGSALSSILDDIETGATSTHAVTPYMVKIGIRHLPDFTKDTTDRNRTSPFAFTGNKFEFRAVGGSATTAFPVMLLNVAASDGLSYVIEKMEAELKKSPDVKAAALNVIRGLVKETKTIRFEGNGYSEEWVAEAAKRGLPNLRKTPEALTQMISKSTIEVFTQLGVLQETDLHARYHVRLESYLKRMTIESLTMLQMVETLILPAGFTYLKDLTDGVISAKGAGLMQPPQVEMANKVAALLTSLQGKRQILRAALDKAESIADLSAQAQHFAFAVANAMEETRVVCDSLEYEVADGVWPLPRYREMLFIS